MLRGYNTVLLSDELKLVGGIGAGIFSSRYSVAKLYGLPRYTSRLQAEILTILRAI